MAEGKDFEGFVDLGQDVDDVHEPVAQPTGTYDVTVTSAKAIYAQKEDGSGQYLKKIQVMLEFDDVKNAATIFHNMTLPTPEMDKKKKDFLIVLMKKFYKLVNVPFSGNGINTTDLIGAKAKGAFVDLTKYRKLDGDGNPAGPETDSNQLNLKSIKV